MVAIGLLTVPAPVQLKSDASAQPLPPRPAAPKPVLPPALPEPDPRTVRLANFFSRLHCPVRDLANEFISAADDNHLDWRLLPSISVVESGGGKAYRNNNIFGWNNGLQLFPSIRNGIHEVAFKLGRSPLYRHRDTAAKLRTYNPDESYAETVMNVMNRISPVVNLKTVTARLAYRPAAYAYQQD